MASLTSIEILMAMKIIAVDITEQRVLEEQLRRQAFSDSLTVWPIIAVFFEVLRARFAEQSVPSGILSSTVGPGWIETDQRPIWAFGGKPGAVPARADPDGLLPVRGHRSRQGGTSLLWSSGDRRGRPILVRGEFVSFLRTMPKSQPFPSASEWPVTRRTPIPSEPFCTQRHGPICDERQALKNCPAGHGS